jgi:hypothetical protein
MKIVTFLQNQWFRDPERMKRQLEVEFKGDRERFIKLWLFWSCRTGQNLESAFTKELCDEIVWEETSREIGGHASSKFTADLDHIDRVIVKHQPDVVVALGKIAKDALLNVTGDTLIYPCARMNWRLIVGPHPVARHATAMQELRDIGKELRTLCSPTAKS